MKTNSFFSQIYALVKKIPPGKVTTYGHIARALGTRDARKIGWALHANTSYQVPCHRVVNREGRLAANFAFGGWAEQKKRLLEEKVIFKDEKTVDIKKCFFKPS